MNFLNNLGSFLLIIVIVQKAVKASEEEILQSQNATGVNSTTDGLSISTLIEELKASNLQLMERVAYLEDKQRRTNILLNSLDSDVKFFNPTVEHGFVDMKVVNWAQVVAEGMNDVGMTFNAGHTLGIPSTWELFLMNNNGSLSVNLALQGHAYPRDALYAGFTLYILDVDENVALTRTLAAIDILDTEDKIISIQNVLPLSAITNAENRLVTNKGKGSFKLRVRLELVGNGHKLYSTEFGPEEVPSKDSQTVVFEISNLVDKLKNNKKGNDSSQGEETFPLAFTRFQLNHPWGKSTLWIAQVRPDAQDNSLALSLSLDNSAEMEVSQLFASFRLKISSDNGMETIATRHVGVNDYRRENVLVEGAISSHKLKSILSEQNANNLTLEFKMYLTVFNQNARFYIDL